MMERDLAMLNQLSAEQKERSEKAKRRILEEGYAQRNKAQEALDAFLSVPKPSRSLFAKLFGLIEKRAG